MELLSTATLRILKCTYVPTTSRGALNTRHVHAASQSPALRMKSDGGNPSSDSKAMYMSARGSSDRLASPRCTVRLPSMPSQISQ